MLLESPVFILLLASCAVAFADQTLLYSCAQKELLPGGDSAAGQFPTQDLGDLVYIGNGATDKSHVFDLNSSSLVLRIAFVHTAQCVFAADIRPSLEHVTVADFDSNKTRLGLKLIELLLQVRPIINIMSSASLSNEHFQTALPSSVPSLVFGVNTVIART